MLSDRLVRPSLLLALVALGLSVLACVSDESQEVPSEPEGPRQMALDPPAGPGAMAPNLTVGGGEVVLSWLEPDDPEAREVYRLRLARLQGETWGAAETVVEGSNFFANWADLPTVAQGGDGTWVTSWLEMLGEGTYAYGIQMAALGEGEWERTGLLHADDASPTEHGFVSSVSVPGGLQAFWLDGRGMAGDPPGPMTLRTALVEDGVPGESTVLDEKVCECCSTDAALTSEGPVTVYRDRSDEEIRDIGVVRAVADGWSEPVQIHDDGWKIQACPVNGPAIAALGKQVAVAWFTAPGGHPQVRLTFSTDGGTTFNEPIVLDDAEPVGRVDVEFDDEGQAWVLWLAREGDAGAIRLQKVDASGSIGESHLVASTSASRSAGVARLVRDGDRLLVAWVEDVKPSRIRVASVSI